MSETYFRFEHEGKDISFVFSSQQDHIARLIMDGSAFYEKEMLVALGRLLSKGDLVVDAGANIGNHSIFFAKCVGCRVIAFEPVISTFSLLRKNIVLNDVESLVDARNVGLGSHGGKARIASFDPANIGGTSLSIEAEGDIEIATLDELIPEDRVALLKVDVEGMDLDVLKGAQKLLRRDRPLVVCEAATETQRIPVSAFMAGLGYVAAACYNATDTYLFMPAKTALEKSKLTGYGFEEVIALQRETRRLQGDIRRSDRYSERLSRESRQYIDTRGTELLKDMKSLQDASERQMRSEIQRISVDLIGAVSNQSDEWMERVAVRFDNHVQSLATLNDRLLDSQRHVSELQFRLSEESRRNTELDACHMERLAECERLDNELVGARQELLKQTEQMEMVRAELVSQTRRLQEAVARLAAGEQSGRRLASTLTRALHALEAQEILSSSLSLQLGNSLLRAVRSPAMAIKLPGTLLRLAREANARRAGMAPRQIVDVGHRVDLASLRSDALGLLENVSFSSGDIESQSGSDLWDAPTESALAALSAGMATKTSRLPVLPKSLSSLKMAVIMDEFTYSSYRHCCDVMQLDPSRWREQLEHYSPDLLFVESAWRGMDDAWKSKIAHCSTELRDVIDWCRARRIPTVFWNKEDPVHFEGFIATASCFDYVFTTDVDCISRYKANLGHDRVYLLPFACQPVTHNPIEQYGRHDAFCFAGAYYTRFPERQKDLDTFIAALRSEAEIHIYDRNYGKDDPAFRFPEQYQSMIQGGLAFDQIDRAYKGYRYNINLNSVKQSQSMFARRIFDLLGCNTVTISNFSLGLKLLFGDLVFTTDSGERVHERLAPLLKDDLAYRRFRLAGLRKILSEHTYQHRLEYVLSKIDEQHPRVEKPLAIMVACVSSQADAQQAHAIFCRQSWPAKRLVLIASQGIGIDSLPRAPDVSILGYESCRRVFPAEKWPGAMLAGISLADSYGIHYLTDMLLAMAYADVRAIGKGAYFRAGDTGVELMNDGGQYRYQDSIDMRSSVLGTELFDKDLRAFADSIDEGAYCGRTFSVDEFHYLRGAADSDLPGIINLPEVDAGIPLAEMLRQAESISAAEFESDHALPRIDGERLAQLFGTQKNGQATADFDPDAGVRVISMIEHDKHIYFYSQPLSLDWWSREELRFNLDVSTNVSMELAVIFQDAAGVRVAVHMVAVGRNHTLTVPQTAESVRFGLRIKGSGEGVVRALYMEHLPADVGVMVVRHRRLVLTNHYPSYDNLYRNGFVHRRVMGYRGLGIDVDVICLSDRQATSHEFEGVDVRHVDREMLRSLLESGGVESVLVHFLDEAMWSVLKDFVDRIRVIVWIHGAEVQPWHRREFNYRTEEEKAKAIVASDARMRLWREIFSETSPLLGFVFVSQYFANEVMEDVGIKLDVSRYEIIHNYIDEELFSYEKKDPEQRFKVLSIRPFASAKYANDLSVKAIVELSRHPVFERMSFHILGDGALFDETLQPLLGMGNVHIERRFLNQGEIAELHKQYGLFLSPTRMDSQGVSRDEAMASGLVPVTNAVTAIPEFVDETCGILVPGEDWRAMAQGILQIVQDPTQFEQLSSNAAKRVRSQSGFDSTIRREVALILLRR